MAAPISKPTKTSHAGQPNNPIYARTSVLCNGQIVWKVAGSQDMEYVQTDPYRAELKPITDVIADLSALNSLQMYRSKPLTPLELKQPLRHVQSSLPKNVKDRIYTGDLYGSAKGVFSCPDDQFKTKAKDMFENELRGDGELNYNDFFRRLRRAEWLLWDVEAEKGRWVAVIAHLYKGPTQNPNKSKPSSIKSSDFNRIDKWCVVTAQRSPEGDAMVDRVRKRLPTVLREGRIEIDKNSEMKPAIWVPMDETDWSSGLRVYALIKTLMHRVTEFHCTGRRHRPTFWHPVSGWLNVDEVRAEMQGRAAQRCMAATGYRSRIAIEGVRRWIGRKEVVRAQELRPRGQDNQAFRTGKVGADGRCIPVGPHRTDSDSSDDGPDDDDDGKGPGGQSKGPDNPPPSGGQGEREDPTDGDGLSKPNLTDYGGPFKTIIPINKPKPNSQAKPSHTQTEPDLAQFGGPFKTIIPINKPKPDPQVKTSNTQNKPDLAQFGGPFKAITSTHITPGKLVEPSELTSTNQIKAHTQNKSNNTNFGGPLDPPPSKVYGWDDDSEDDRGPFQHIPLDRLDKLGSYGQALMKKATSQAQTIQNAQNTQNTQTMQNALNALNIQIAQYTQNALGIQNAQNTQNKNTLNALNIQNAQNAQNAQNTQNTQTAQNALNALNIQIAQYTQNALNTQNTQNTQNKPSNTNFAGPLDSPPSKVYGWDDDSEDDRGPFKHIPLTKLPLFEESEGLKEPTTPGKPSSAKGTTGKSTQGNKKQSQAKQDPKGKGKLVDKPKQTNSKRKAQEAATTSATKKGGDDSVASTSKKRVRTTASKKGLNSILGMLGSP